MNLMTLSVEGSRARLLVLAAIVACLLGVNSYAADTKIYLEIKGIPGDVTDRRYEDQIAVTSYSLTPEPAGGGSLSITKPVDSSSSILSAFAAAGEAIKRAILRVVQSTNGKTKVKTTINFDDVIISSYQLSGNSTGELPMESVTLNYAKVTTKYLQQEKKGEKKTGNSAGPGRK
jgi:type VI secretion system secreted protein Hcp